MRSAKDIMTPDPITVTPDSDVTWAAELLLKKGFNGLPVVNQEGDLVGILCQADLISQQKKLNLPSVFTVLDSLIPLSSVTEFEKEMTKITATKVEGVMTPNPVSVSPDTEVEEIATLMVDRKLHTLPVVDGGKLVGVVGMQDVLRTLRARAEQSE